MCSREEVDHLIEQLAAAPDRRMAIIMLFAALDHSLNILDDYFARGDEAGLMLWVDAFTDIHEEAKRERLFRMLKMNHVNVHYLIMAVQERRESPTTKELRELLEPLLFGETEKKIITPIHLHPDTVWLEMDKALDN